MNKLGMVLGLAAVATLAGCKDPDYRHDDGQQSQREVKNIDTTPAPAVQPIVIEPVTRKCTCPAGTRHTSPCTCGAPDCKCIVETKPVYVPAAKPVAPAAPETTVYIVQEGDYLAKISKKFNVSISSIKRVNNLKNDTIRVGQKLKLPGKFDVGEQTVPKAAKPAAKASKATAYTGATKEYVVKSGDTLGSIAYGNGINIRQLKALNGLTSDVLKVGQKLKIPAEKVVKPAKDAAKDAKSKAAPASAKKQAEVKEAAPAAAPAATEENAADSQDMAEPASAAGSAGETAEVKPAGSSSATTYVVKEGDDMTGVSIRWGVSAADIRELNNMSENDQLVPGQTIKIPADAQQ